MASQHRTLTWAVITVLLLLGFALRSYDLTGAPLGISGDELFYSYDARLVLRGEFPIYFPNNYGHEPLFPYLQALFMRLLGQYAFTLRYTTVFGGMLGLAMCYALARRLFQRRVALVTLTLFATIVWSLFLTRIGLRAFTFPVLTMFALYSLWRALQERSWRWAIAAGCLNGLTMYTYVASRVFPAVILGWLLFLVIFNRAWITRNLARLVAFAVLAGLIWLPLLTYSLQNPDVVNQRLSTMGGPFYEIQRGDWAGLLNNAGAVAGMFVVRGDPDGRYNPPARPVFDPLLGACFIVGLLLALRHFRRPAEALLLIWLPIALLPSLLSPTAPAFLRASGAIFPTYSLAACGLIWLLALVERRLPSVFTPRRWALLGLIGALVLAAINFAAFYGEWRTSPEMMKVYESDLYLAARYLQQNPPPPEANVVLVAGAAADDAPRLFRLLDARRHAVRWTADMLWPSSTAETWYLFSQETAPDDQVRGWLGTAPTHVEVNNAGEPVLEIYRLPERPPLPQPDQPFNAQFVGLANLIGVNYSPSAQRGGHVSIHLFWQVPPERSFDATDPPSMRLRLQSDNGLIWSEDSALLAFPPTQWQTGDVWVQRFTLDVPPDMPPQTIRPELAVTNRQDMWPVISEAESLARTAAALPPLRVTGRPAPFDPPSNAVVLYGESMALLAIGADRSALPGLPFHIGTTWQALRDLNQDYALHVQLLRPDETPAYEMTTTLLSDIYPTHDWRAGERLTSNDPLTVPLDLETGEYAVRLRLLDERGQPVAPAAWAQAGRVQISGRRHDFNPPTDALPLDAAFGTVARLAGYQIDQADLRPGGGITLTLFWQALQPTAQSYKVFTHLYNAEDALVGQHDGVPGDGAAPTSGWLPGEYVEDVHILPIDAAARGLLRLGVGLYDPETLQRLPVQAAAKQSDAAIVTEIPLP